MIRLSREVYDSIVYHAYAGNDEEVCGVLAGTYGSAESRVLDARQATNVAETPQIRYRIDPAAQFEIIEGIEEEEMAVVGFYTPGWPDDPQRDRHRPCDLAGPLVSHLCTRRLPLRGFVAIPGGDGHARTGGCRRTGPARDRRLSF